MKRKGRFEATSQVPDTQKRKRKEQQLLHVYLSSLASLLICCTMFLGTTMAWFTDSVTSVGNQITIGELKVDVRYNGTSLKGSSAPIFGAGITWGPNHYEVRTLTIENYGSLDLKYTLNLLLQTDAENNTAEIAKYFQVYVKKVDEDTDTSQLKLREIQSWGAVGGGTLADVFAKGLDVFSGTLEAADTAAQTDSEIPVSVKETYAIALYMTTDDIPAELQGKRLMLNIKLNAYQDDMPQEEIDNPTIRVTTAEGLISVLESGSSATLNNDISADRMITLGAGTVLNGSGYTIDAAQASTDPDCVINTLGGTVKNVTIRNAQRGIGSGSSGDNAMEEDLYLENVTVDGCLYALNIGIGNGYKLEVKNSALYGWTSYSGLSSAAFTDVTFAMGNAKDPGYENYGGYLKAYDDTVFTNCAFGENFHIAAGEVGITVTLNNCTYNGEPVTAETFADLLTYDIAYDSEAGNLKDSTVIVDDVTVSPDSYH